MQTQEGINLKKNRRQLILLKRPDHLLLFFFYKVTFCKSEKIFWHSLNKYE